MDCRNWVVLRADRGGRSGDLVEQIDRVEVRPSRVTNRVDSSFQLLSHVLTYLPIVILQVRSQLRTC
jgi:hypothetical protein